MSDAPQGNSSRISSFVLLIIFVTLALSMAALILAINTYTTNQGLAGYLLIIGFLGVAISTYVLFQTRRRIMHMRIEAPAVMTTIECKKCNFKNIREFQRGDYIFKEIEPCQKCNEKMLITAIYREVHEKESRSRF